MNVFKSSPGVHSAMLHDNIMMSADSDYLLVESEANKVAKQAALALKQSRLRCQQNTLPGLPTWTGRNGVAGSPSLAARSVDDTHCITHLAHLTPSEILNCPGYDVKLIHCVLGKLWPCLHFQAFG